LGWRWAGTWLGLRLAARAAERMNRPALLCALLSALAGSLTLPAASRADGSRAIAPASEDYVLHCSACHGPDGSGTPGVTPSLHGVSSLADTPEGRRYLARVPGVAQAPLSDERLARLLNWALAQFGGGEPAPPYTGEEIAPLRRDPLRDPVAARAALPGAEP
jgi:mono/diheme cytochrome c family protein